MLGSTVSRLLWGYVVDHVPVRVCLAVTRVARGLGDLSLIVVPYPFNIATFVLPSGVLSSAFALLQPMAFANHYGRTFLGLALDMDNDESCWNKLRKAEIAPEDRKYAR